MSDVVAVTALVYELTHEVCSCFVLIFHIYGAPALEGYCAELSPLWGSREVQLV